MQQVSVSSGSVDSNSRTSFRLLCWLLIVLSWASRAALYFSNGSVGSDEAKLAINLVEKGWSDLLAPLTYNQAAPIGFLALQKLVTVALGPSEWSLRLVPFAASIVSSIVFLILVRKLLMSPGVLFSMAAFAAGEFVISQASNAKQYSTDILIASWIMLEFIRFQSAPRTGKGRLRIASSGLISLLLSQSSIFMIATIAVGMLIGSTARNRFTISRVVGDWLVVCAWALVFATQYFLTIWPLRGNEFLNTYWMETRDGSPNWSESFASWIGWFPMAIAKAMREPVGLGSTTVATAVMLLGAVRLWRSRRGAFLLLVTPIALTLCAATLGRYPFADRLLFFLVPSIFGVIGAGVDSLLLHRFRAFQVAGVAVVLALLAHPVQIWAKEIYSARDRNPDIRELLMKMEPNLRSGDVIYARKMAGPTVRYYLRDMHVLKGDVPLLIVDDYYRPPNAGASNSLRRVTSQYISLSAAEVLSRATGDRIWVIIQVRRLATDDVSSDEFITECRQVAEQVDSIVARGAGAFAFIPKASDDNGN